MKESQKQLLALFDKIALFEDFLEEEKAEIASQDSAIIGFDSGEYILRQGESDHAIFVLLKGQVQVKKRENSRKILATLHPGAIFGEISYLTQKPHITNVISIGKSFVLKLDGIRIEKFNPVPQKKIAINLAKILARRLDAGNKVISKVSRQQPPLPAAFNAVLHP